MYTSAFTYRFTQAKGLLEVVAMELPQKLLLRCGGGRAGQVVLLSAVGSSGQVEASNWILGFQLAIRYGGARCSGRSGGRGGTEGLYTVVLKMRNSKGQIDAGAGGAGGANYAFGGQVNASKWIFKGFQTGVWYLGATCSASLVDKTKSCRKNCWG